MGGPRLRREVRVSMGKSTLCARQFIKDIKKGERCMVDVMRITVHRV